MQNFDGRADSEIITLEFLGYIMMVKCWTFILFNYYWNDVLGITTFFKLMSNYLVLPWCVGVNIIFIQMNEKPYNNNDSQPYYKGIKILLAVQWNCESNNILYFEVIIQQVDVTILILDTVLLELLFTWIHLLIVCFIFCKVFLSIVVFCARR